MYDKILVPLDGSETALCGLREAIRLSVELKSRLLLLNVITDVPLLIEMASSVSYDESMKQLRQAANALLATAKQTALDAGVKEVETACGELVQGSADVIILEEVSKEGCDLIVMGTHGRSGLGRLALGSCAEQVVRRSPVPVLLVRGEHPGAADPERRQS